MTITERAAQVLQEIDAKRARIHQYVVQRKGGDYSVLTHDQVVIGNLIAELAEMDDALRCLKTAIEGLLAGALLPFNVNAGYTQILTTLCDQWKGGQP